MDIILDFLRTDTFLLIMLGMIVLLIILCFSTIIRFGKVRKDYSKYMEKLGNGNNIDEMLKQYIQKVDEVATENDEIVSYCQKIDNDIAKCTQKIGMVRYNAFRDTGSELSFSLALLNQHNDGVVLNGIYARDTSNIYAKPISNGQSSYALSDEEKEAINRAINNNK